MAKRKRRKKKSTDWSSALRDERIPKILGLFCLFISIYLFIAFLSYLFTWQTDQDQVLRFSWSLLFLKNIELANWLGRLGAIISNLFFYWLYGLPSFLLVWVFALLGYTWLLGKKTGKLLGQIGLLIGLMLYLSVTLEFLAGDSGFPWGGAFGEAVTAWLTNFVGTIGLATFLVFLLAVFFIWIFNPDVEDKLPTEGNWGFLQTFIRNVNNLTTRTQTEAAVEGSSGSSKNTQKNKRPEPTSEGSGHAIDFETPEPRARPKEKPASKDLGLEINEPVQEETAPATDEKRQDKDPIRTPVEQIQTSKDDPYDPTLALRNYKYPTLDLLYSYDDQKLEIDREELEKNKDQIIDTLLNYKIEIVKIRATIGPTVTLYEIVPAPGVRLSKIKNLEDDIALSLAALGIRIIAPIPGKGTVGIEVPNKKKQIVSLKEVIKSDKFRNAKMDLPIALGKTISNEVFVGDLAKMPHLLIAGATGQGKSVGINTVLCSLLYKKHPSQVKFVLIDPKKVELFPYSKLENHFLAYLPGLEDPIVTDTEKVVHTLNSLSIEMDERYELLKKAHARNIREYNEKFIDRKLNPNKGHRFMPFIILVIDEFADLIMTAGKDIELPIGRLAQLSRAVGIHLIIATQRPSVNIITGVIKANFPARIAFKVTAKVDSRTILDTGGADRLIGRGDMLLSFGAELVRLQCAFVDTPEVEQVIEFIHDQPGFSMPYFLPEFQDDDAEIKGTSGIKFSDLDEMFEDAARLVVQNQLGSTSMIQRKLRLGYNRAGRIMDQMEALGIVGQHEGSKAREVLILDEQDLEQHLETLRKQS